VLDGHSGESVLAGSGGERMLVGLTLPAAIDILMSVGAEGGKFSFLP
jgi:hypothetical protein